jgi:hypothetical protein
VGKATATRTPTRSANIGTGLGREGAKQTKIQNPKNFQSFVASRLLLID